MTLIKKCYLDSRDEVIQLLSSQSNSIDAIDDLLFKLAQISRKYDESGSINANQTQYFNSGQFINLCNFYRDICSKTTELAKNRLKANNQFKAANSKISYGFDEEYMITAIFAGIKKYACWAFDIAEKWDLFLSEKFPCDESLDSAVGLDFTNNEKTAKTVKTAKTANPTAPTTKSGREADGIAISKREVCVLLAASVFGLTNGVNLLTFIINNDVIPFTCLLEYFNRRLDITNEEDPFFIIKSAENDVTEKTLNKMCNLITAANDTALPRVMLFVADTSLYSSICYNQVHHVGTIGKTKEISYECNKNLEMPEIIIRDIFKIDNRIGGGDSGKNLGKNAQQLMIKHKPINYVFGAEYYSCIKPSQDVSIKHQMYGVGAINDKFPRTTDGTVARCMIFDEINPLFFRSTQKQTNITRILNYFDIFAQRIHFYKMCCSELFIDTPQNTICVSVNPQAIKHIQILEFFAVLIAAGLEGRDIEFHTGLVNSAEEHGDENDNNAGTKRADFAEQFLAFMQKCRKNRVSIAELYAAILEFIKKIRRDVNNGYGEFDLMKVSFFDVI